MTRIMLVFGVSVLIVCNSLIVFYFTSEELPVHEKASVACTREVEVVWEDCFLLVQLNHQTQQEVEQGKQNQYYNLAEWQSNLVQAEVDSKQDWRQVRGDLDYFLSPLLVFFQFPRCFLGRSCEILVVDKHEHEVLVVLEFGDIALVLPKLKVVHNAADNSK